MQNQSNKVGLRRQSFRFDIPRSSTRKRVLVTVAGALLATVLLGVQSHASHVIINTHQEKITDLAAHPTISTARSGSWSDPGTWAQARIPGTGDIVAVGSTHRVVYDRWSDDVLNAIGVDGVLEFSSSSSTRLIVGTLLVRSLGRMTVGTIESPIPSNVTAELVIADRPATDPGQFGTGLIVLGGISFHGALKSPTWTRLATEPTAGATTLQLLNPVTGWRAGDRLVLPDTRHLDDEDASATQTETRTIASISSDGRNVTLNSALSFNHRGARNPDGSMVMGPSGQQLLPHVGNLSRNVVIRSANPNGTRGHVMITDQARADIRYAEFRDLGRTTTADVSSSNQGGRYWLHLHHLWGSVRSMPSGMSDAQIRSWLDANGWQFAIVGNSVAASLGTNSNRRWGITLHNSHFGLVTDNVIYNVAGAGIQTETGNESYNLIARNFMVRIPGTGHQRIDEDEPLNVGNDGTGLWARGPHNWHEGNVAADTTFSGLYFSSYYLKELRQPRFPGDDTMNSGTITKLRRMLSFTDNEAYGPMAHGLWGAWVSGCCDAGGWSEIPITRLAIWHPFEAAIKWYHNGRTTMRDLVIRGDPAVSAAISIPNTESNDQPGKVMDLTSYENVELTVERFDARGYVFGIHTPRITVESGNEGPALFRDGVLQNYINVRIPGRSGGGPGWSLFDHVQFLTWKRPGFSNYPTPLAIEMDYQDDDTASPGSVRAEVSAYNRTTGDNFRLYYLEDGGAPCATRRTEIRGFACPIQVSTPPPSTPPPSSSPPLAPSNLVLK
jgi:G8 domain